MNIGDIAIIPFTLAITQALKSIFGIEGKKNQIVAVCVATVLTLASLVIAQELVSPQIALWIEIVIKALGGGLSAIGLFDYISREVMLRE